MEMGRLLLTLSGVSDMRIYIRLGPVPLPFYVLNCQSGRCYCQRCSNYWDSQLIQWSCKAIISNHSNNK
jgi:hypothetical protein